MRASERSAASGPTGSPRPQPDGAAHTPGPWVIRWKPVTVSIHTLGGDYITENVRELPNQEANARLIAAAPDLLATLKALALAAVKAMGDDEAEIRAAIAAIAKAEGL
jgi:hypothetical protein